MQGMVAQRLGVTAIARVFHRQMAGGAAVHAVEVGQDSLADFHGNAFGQQPLLGRGGPVDFLLNVFALVILPLPVLVAVIADNDQNSDQQAERGKPTVKFADGKVLHLNAPPSRRVDFSTVPPMTNWTVEEAADHRQRHGNGKANRENSIGYNAFAGEPAAHAVAFAVDVGQERQRRHEQPRHHHAAPERRVAAIRKSLNQSRT